jgi:hypothetical protein
MFSVVPTLLKYAVINRGGGISRYISLFTVIAVILYKWGRGVFEISIPDQS